MLWRRGFTLSVLFVLSCVLLSCVSSPVKDDTLVMDVDAKIRDDFSRNVAEGDFTSACRSYIEYASCCVGLKESGVNDAGRALLLELGDLYAKKAGELEEGKDTLRLVEYTYSFLSLARSAGMEQELSSAAEKLPVYVDRYLSSDLAGKGGVEMLSWLIHMARFLPEEPSIYRRIVELSVEQKNPLLARKYLALFERARDSRASDFPSEAERESAPDVARELREKIQNLQAANAWEDSGPEIPIDDTIRSSVKIIVDKGIKTHGGVGMPDQLLGTGVVIDEQGYIITNHHIIESSVDPKYEGYSKVYVIPGKDENLRFVAKIVGYDAVFDLALLKIEKKLDSLIRYGNSDALKQGERVIAIGNPVGLTNTVTSGVVSSTDRPFLQIGNIVQIDAALNPGNSGGALIDSKGYLVGIAFAGLQQFENLNFAIPSNLLLSLLFKLYGGGKATRSWIGCALEGGDTGGSGLDRNDLEGQSADSSGVAINYIVSGGPADTAGLRKGDLIRKVNGKPVSEIYDVQDAISYFSSPLVVNLAIERDKATFIRSVLVEERPEIPSLYVYKRDAYENLVTPLFGIVLNASGDGKRRTYTILRVVSGSVASGVGISEGDIIKIRTIKYDEKLRVFSMAIEIKSKRFGYLTRPLVLYSYAETNSFV
jgi:S1-C subfamily serine protease